MDNELLKTLKELKRIQPDSTYSTRSRALILAAKQETKSATKYWQWIYSPKFAMPIGIAIILVLMISGGLYYINKSSQKDLVVKASELNASIQIKLNEIKYLLENDQTDSKTISAIQTLLEKAVNDLKEASSLNLEEKKLEESLQKLKSAQEVLVQIDFLLKK